MEQTEERRALREVVRDLLARRDDPWPGLCKVGAAGLAIPERYGGAGATLLETHIVLEELGRTLTPAPLLGSAVLAAQALLLSSSDGCERLLPGIADGSAVAALAWTGADGRWDVPAVAASSGGSLSGTAHYVLDGDTAGTLLVVASDGTLYEVDSADPAVTRAAVTAVDLTRRLAVVELRGAAGRPLGPCPLDHLRDIACVALSAEQVGAAGRALELTVEHTRTRVQFGQPIGAFQALQHRLADLHVLVESARSASYAAVSALVAGAPETPALAAVAKVHCSETLQAVAAEMIQMHGGIGITWEHDAHRYFKRAHGSAHLFGHPRTHVTRLAALVLDPPLE